MRAKAKQRETPYAGKLGDWQRILAPLAAIAADLLPHLEIPRTQLVALLTPAVGIQKQPAASPGDPGDGLPAAQVDARRRPAAGGAAAPGGPAALQPRVADRHPEVPV